LGAGAGGTAAALADLGHQVVAIDIAPLSVTFARQLAQEPRPGTLEVREADFFTVSFDGTFDVVAYWNGFGIGRDADQRRLLRRIASAWLAPGGSLLLDVFNPVPWLRIAGQEKRVETDHAGVFIERHDYDPVGNRFIESWSREADPADRSENQSIRCYSPADFLLLLEGVHLIIKRAEANGVAFDMEARGSDLTGALGNTWEYLVQLVSEPS